MAQLQQVTDKEGNIKFVQVAVQRNQVKRGQFLQTFVKPTQQQKTGCCGKKGKRG